MRGWSWVVVDWSTFCTGARNLELGGFLFRGSDFGFFRVWRDGCRESPKQLLSQIVRQGGSALPLGEDIIIRTGV